jgi:hypothetical protein
MLAARGQIDRHRDGFACPTAERLPLAPALVFRRKRATGKRLVCRAGDQRAPAVVRAAADPDPDRGIGRDVADPVSPFAAAGQEIDLRAVGVRTEPQLDATFLSADATGGLQVAEVLPCFLQRDDSAIDPCDDLLAPLD